MPKTPHCWCTLFLQCRSLDGNSVESASWKYQGGSRILRFQFRISHRSIRGYSCSSDLFCPLYQMVSEICTDCQNHGAKILAITDSISSPAWALADHAIITEINLNEMGFNSFSCLYCLFDSIVAKIRKTRCKSISTRLHDLEELYSDFDLFTDNNFRGLSCRKF